MSAFEKIDAALGSYYHGLGVYDYFDNIGIGKFLRYCHEQEFDANDIEDELADGNESNCGYLEFDADFPYTAPIEYKGNESEKEMEIFRVLQHCYKTGHAPILTDIDMGIEYINNPSHKPKRKFQFASPERAQRFVLNINPNSELRVTLKKEDYAFESEKERKRKMNPTIYNHDRFNNRFNRFEEKENENEKENEIEEILELKEEEEKTDLEKLCDGIGAYYVRMMRGNDYYDSFGCGKFTKWFENEEMDINEMKEELIEGNFNDCSYLDFDCDEITKINRFPLPFEFENCKNENEKLEKQFEIMAYIFESQNGLAAQNIVHFDKDILPQINAYNIDFDLQQIDMDKCKKLYELQCPRLMRLFSKEFDLMYLLTIGYYNNIPFALWMVDCFMRDRLKYYFTNHKELTVNQWTQNHIHKYIQAIKKKQSTNDIETCLQHGIKGYIYRILPKFKTNVSVNFTIKDDLFEIAHYFEAASQFILKIINENKQEAHTPFQWDFNIAVRDVTDCSNIVIPDIDNMHNNINASEFESDEYYDIIGDIKKKLVKNKCAYYVAEVDNEADNNRLKNNLLIRVFKKSYDKFKHKYHKFKRFKADNTFPRMRRFCTLIDRRKWITVTDEKTQCIRRDSDSDCEYHEMMDRNCSANKKDDIYFWIPPNNCNMLPNQKSGYVSEVYFENLNKCIIPRIGYIDTINDAQHFYIEDTFATNHAIKCQLLRKTFTNQCMHDGVLTFNFHVQSCDEIRCYLWYKGTGIRFLPNDIVNILPKLFDTKYENNDKFCQSDNIKQLIQQIQFHDKCFEKWYQQCHHHQ